MKNELKTFSKELDENNLNYFCQRYYEAEIGRFLRLDPENSPASSPYAYCVNNPLRFTDPTGERMMESKKESPVDAGDPSWWTFIHMEQLRRQSKLMNAMRSLEKMLDQITYDDWESYHPGGKITLDDILNAISWLKENSGFLATIDYWAEVSKFEYMIVEHLGKSVAGNPKNEILTIWEFKINKMQWNKTWSLRKSFAHEFAEIIWLRAHGWTRTDLSWWNIIHRKANNSGHLFANRWVYFYFYRK